MFVDEETKEILRLAGLNEQEVVQLAQKRAEKALSKYKSDMAIEARLQLLEMIPQISDLVVEQLVAEARFAWQLADRLEQLAPGEEDEAEMVVRQLGGDALDAAIDHFARVLKETTRDKLDELLSKLKKNA